MAFPNDKKTGIRLLPNARLTVGLDLAGSAFLFQRLPGAILSLNHRVLQLVAKVCPEGFQIFLPALVAFRRLFGGQVPLPGQPGQFVDAVNICLFHMLFPFGLRQIVL